MTRSQGAPTSSWHNLTVWYALSFGTNSLTLNDDDDDDDNDDDDDPEMFLLFA